MNYKKLIIASFVITALSSQVFEKELQVYDGAEQ